jgi:hypothetical protein
VSIASYRAPSRDSGGGGSVGGIAGGCGVAATARRAAAPANMPSSVDCRKTDVGRGLAGEAAALVTDGVGVAGKDAKVGAGGGGEPTLKLMALLVGCAEQVVATALDAATPWALATACVARLFRQANAMVDAPPPQAAPLAAATAGRLYASEAILALLSLSMMETCRDGDLSSTITL